MKKCPFCYEDIQNEAIKCKHCSEFLNKKDNSIILDNLKNLIPKKEITNLENPTDENPLGNNNIIFKSNTFEWNNTIFPYEVIVNIGFRASITRQSFITNRKLIFTLGVYANFNGSDSFYDINVLSRRFEPLELSIDKESFEVYNVIYNFIASKTLQKRFQNYIDLTRSALLN